MLTGECTAACNYNYKLQLSIASSSRLLLYFFLSRLRGKEETAMAFFSQNWLGVHILQMNSVVWGKQQIILLIDKHYFYLIFLKKAYVAIYKWACGPYFL